MSDLATGHQMLSSLFRMHRLTSPPNKDKINQQSNELTTDNPLPNSIIQLPSFPSSSQCQGRQEGGENMSKDVEDSSHSSNSLQESLEALIKRSGKSLNINYTNGAFVIQTDDAQEVKSASLQEALEMIQHTTPSIDFSTKPWFINPKQFLLFLFEQGKIDFNFKQTTIDFNSSNSLFTANVEFTNGQTIQASAKSKKEAERMAFYSLLSQLECSLGGSGGSMEIEKKAPTSNILNSCYQTIQSNTTQSNLICAYYSKLSYEGKRQPKVLLQYDGKDWHASIDFISLPNEQEEGSIGEVRECKTFSKTKTTAYKLLVEMLYELVLKEINADRTYLQVNQPTKSIPPTSNSCIQFDVEVDQEVSERLTQFLRNSYQFNQTFSPVESLPIAEDEVDFILENNDSVIQKQLLLDKKSQELKDKLTFNFTNYPIKKYRDEILKKIDSNQVIIIKGSAGCGKTTQVPSYLLHQYSVYSIGGSCNVIVGEPRKIAAKNAAFRVAEEWNEPLGGRIGYNVRFDKQLPEQNGSITYCTNGVLLRMLTNPTKIRSYFSHLILDEVHERSVEVDLLLLAVKTLLRENSDLKVVLMSGTIDCKIFQDYFNPFKVEIVTVEQEIFPIKSFTLDHFPALLKDYSKFTDPISKDFVKNELIEFVPGESKQQDNSIPYELISYILKIVMNNLSITGDVLIFLPGWENIQTLFKLLEPVYSSKNISLLVMHSMIGQEQHDLIFTKTNKRRIILSTNIAESSITIETVSVVIDTLKEKKPLFEHETRIRSFSLDWISLASMAQRKGRAGRTGHGYYYAIASQHRIDRLEPYSRPEIQMLDLCDICLRVKSIAHRWPGIGSKIEEILSDTPSPPSTTAADQAIERLTALGALEPEEERLTYLGQLLARIPIDPELGKLLLVSCLFGCLDPILIIVAVLSIDCSLYVRKPQSIITPHSKEPEDCRLKWSSMIENCDLIAIIHTFNEWYSVKLNHTAEEEMEYCIKFGISISTIQKAFEVKNQLQQIIQEELFLPSFTGRNDDQYSFNIDYNINSSNMVLVKGLIMSTFCDNLFIRSNSKSLSGKLPFNTGSSSGGGMSAIIHPSSSHATRCNYSNNSIETTTSIGGSVEKLKNIPYFYERSQRNNNRLYLFNLVKCTNAQLMFFSNLESTFKDGVGGNEIWSCRGLYSFKGQAQLINCIFGLRHVFENICNDFYKSISMGLDAKSVANNVCTNKRLSGKKEFKSEHLNDNSSPLKELLIGDFIRVFVCFMEE